MALPNSTDAATPPGSASPSLGDDQFRALKLFLEDVFGIPDNTSITVAATAIVAGGLDEVIFRNAAANASATRRLRANSTYLTFHDGTAARRIDMLASGTVMLFRQSTAPTGWTRLVDATITDSVIIARTNSETPTTGGSWTISGLTFSGSALATHQHEGPFGFNNAGPRAYERNHPFGSTNRNGVNSAGTAWSADTTNVAFDLVEAVSAGTPAGSIASSGAWRPLFIETIIATKD